ncbi:tRNA-dihydrouridine synthase, partial [Neorhizobium sp. BETTINA12A]
VMVGRGAQGRPWHVGWLAGHAGPTRSEIPGLVVEHYEAMLELYGREAGLRHARKQLGWYLDRYAAGLPVEEKAAIMISKDPADVSRRMTAALGGQPVDAQKEAA